jgi:hypothetical protein
LVGRRLRLGLLPGSLRNGTIGRCERRQGIRRSSSPLYSRPPERSNLRTIAPDVFVVRSSAACSPHWCRDSDLRPDRHGTARPAPRGHPLGIAEVEVLDQVPASPMRCSPCPTAPAARRPARRCRRLPARPRPWPPGPGSGRQCGRDRRSKAAWPKRPCANEGRDDGDERCRRSKPWDLQ